MIDPPPGQMGLADIVATAFGAYRRAPLAWLSITLLFFVVTFALEWALGDRLDLPTDASDEQIREAAPTFGAVFGTGIVLGLFTQVALVDGAARALAGHPIGVGLAYANALRRFLSIVVAVLISSAIAGLLGATIILIPLGIYFLVSWSMSIPVIVVERTGPLRALSRSRQVVRGQWWRTLGITLAVLALSLLPGFAFSAVGGAIDQPWATALGAALGGAIAAPFTGLAQTLLYADLRVRKGEKPFEPLPEAAL